MTQQSSDGGSTWFPANWPGFNFDQFPELPPLPYVGPPTPDVPPGPNPSDQDYGPTSYGYNNWNPGGDSGGSSGESSGGGYGGSSGGGGGWTPPHSPASQPIANSTNAAPDIFKDYSGPQIDAAKSLVKQFLSTMGYPQTVDANQLALDLLKGNLQGNPGDAFEHMYWGINDEMRQANPWARFGMDVESYHSRLGGAQLSLKNLTGLDVDLKAVGQTTGTEQLLQNAVRYGWSQSEMLDRIKDGFTNLGGGHVDLSQLYQSESWLAAGQTYTQLSSQWATIYGAPPTDTKTLDSWFRFNQGSRQIGGGGGAVLHDQSHPVGTEVR